MLYTLKIWYAATPDDDPQIERGLTAERVFDYVRPEVGFMSDLLNLEGRGVRRLCIEAESPETQAFREVEQAGKTIGTIREAAGRQGVDLR